MLGIWAAGCVIAIALSIGVLERLSIKLGSMGLAGALLLIYSATEFLRTDWGQATDWVRLVVTVGAIVLIGIGIDRAAKASSEA